MKSTHSDYAWRVKVLDDSNAGTGLFRGFACEFTIPDYWEYGLFEPKGHCELPGKRFVCRASTASPHAYYAPGFDAVACIYHFGDEKLYAAWRVRSPDRRIPDGQFSLVCPLPGPWRIWCNRSEEGKLLWYLETSVAGHRQVQKLACAAPDGDWLSVMVSMEQDAVTLTVENQEAGRYRHDPYRDDFIITFGCGQPDEEGPEVVSEYSEIYIHNIPYPYATDPTVQGPEDVRPEDQALCYMVNPATPERPRHGEGSILVLKDRSLLMIWTEYYAGEGWDGSPAHLSAMTSTDGGRTWSDKRVVVEDEYSNNVMSASLLYNRKGEILLVYHDQLPDMKAKSMVLRRSGDEGRTWTEPVCITPDNGNRHSANNDSLSMLEHGRIVLATREYIDGIRWPYCLYSDDDGYTWKQGAHVPDPGLSERLKKGQNVNEPSVVQLADGRLLMTMRSVAGGQFFSYSSDEGYTWSKPYLSPLRSACSPASLFRIPGTDDILAIWTYGYAGRTPLVSAISHDCGKSWEHLKLVEQSQYHGYDYTSITVAKDRIYLSYMHSPGLRSLIRFEVAPGYHDQRLTVLPVKWFYRDVKT